MSSEPGQERRKGGGGSGHVKVFSCGYLILFNWDENITKPFNIYPRKNFAQEIKDRSIERHLPDDLRVKKLKHLKSLPGQQMSLFAKVEASELLYPTDHLKKKNKKKKLNSSNDVSEVPDEFKFVIDN